MSTVATRIGTFVWHEHVSSDPEQAKQFYTELFGWGTEVFKPGEVDYAMISAGGRTHGGFSTAMEGAPPPHWLGHVRVENVDQTVEKTKNAGGSLAAGPFDMEDVGKMAIISDPQGAYVGIYQPHGEGGDAEGVFVWDELGTNDPDGAQRFYEQVFGWTTKDMGEDFGGYRIFDRVEGTGQGVAGLMKNPDNAIPPMWTPYVGVEDADATCARAQELGGTALVEPTDIPTVGRFAVIKDPQGAVFGVIKGEPQS
ncbi:MAG TPA: VOC family protein [Gaiellaceae bacterium]